MKAASTSSKATRMGRKSDSVCAHVDGVETVAGEWGGDGGRRACRVGGSLGGRWERRERREDREDRERKGGSPGVAGVARRGRSGEGTGEERGGAQGGQGGQGAQGGQPGHGRGGQGRRKLRRGHTSHVCSAWGEGGHRGGTHHGGARALRVEDLLQHCHLWLGS
jgi:hypothetical protein